MKILHTTGGLAKLGGEVIAQSEVRPLTVSDSPSGVQLNPQLHQAARALSANGGSAVEKQ